MQFQMQFLHRMLQIAHQFESMDQRGLSVLISPDG
jgi:hypothetical protein